ncbi:MAG TPA: hypothetical protein VHC41_09510 [Mycobacteriales bacterium]|nr:hypothetical protein [Mycobacteriales bacterium]
MSDTAETALLAVLLLASSIWVGGFIAIGVVARVVGRTLQTADRVAFFRALGRSYGVVGGIALLVTLGTGAALATNHDWDGTMLATLIVAVALVVVTAVGVVQARRMTRLRQRALAQPGDGSITAQVAGGARDATALRAGIGLLTFTLLALAAVLAT